MGRRVGNAIGHIFGRARSKNVHESKELSANCSAAQLSISPPEEDEAFLERICWKEDICHLCGPMLRCTTCGNNCCNGGSGEVNGGKCQDCPRVYEEMKRRDAASLCQSQSHPIL